ncbi:MAG: hypothetical protein GY805_12515 [Chloroflexi bacterium]|nr:hypothetical protein [Chloroflexota bacterium]
MAVASLYVRERPSLAERPGEEAPGPGTDAPPKTPAKRLPPFLPDTDYGR